MMFHDVLLFLLFLLFLILLLLSERTSGVSPVIFIFNMLFYKFLLVALPDIQICTWKLCKNLQLIQLPPPGEKLRRKKFQMIKKKKNSKEMFRVCLRALRVQLNREGGQPCIFTYQHQIFGFV